MKPSRFWLALLLLPSAALAGTPPVAKPKTADSSGWVFSLLPKSFQKNPYLELTVITEVTEEGKKLPLVTPAHPAFYTVYSGGYHPLGDNGGQKHPLPQAEVEKLLTSALASNGYRPAQLPAQPPSIVIFYTWGTHNLLVEGDPDNPALSGSQVAANLLDRSRLVGGEKFARKMLELFQQAENLDAASNIHMAPGGEAPIDAAAQGMLNPVNLFKAQDRKNEALVDQAADDIYYVVASAYDYQALTTRQRKLLWRTSMTVAANAVSEGQTLPTLIAAAAPYFGKEMESAEVLTKRAVREGQVEVGTPVVVEPSKVVEPPKEKPPEKK